MLLLWENLLLGRRNALGTFRDGMENAVGGGETPRLWGGKPASSVCCDYVAFVLFFQIVTAPGSAVVNVLLSCCSMVCFSIYSLGFWPGQGCSKLFSLQAVCDTYVNQLNKQ